MPPPCFLSTRFRHPTGPRRVQHRVQRAARAADGAVDRRAALGGRGAVRVAAALVCGHGRRQSDAGRKVCVWGVGQET